MFNVQWKICTFAAAFKTSKHWRDGRVVDYSSLENYRTERYPGVRIPLSPQRFEKPAESAGFFLFLNG